jgi:TonB family protein
MNRKISFLFLAVLLLQTATAHADSLKDALNDKYKNQILALRSPLTKGDQKFDSAGHSLSIAKSSGWLLYGGISVKRIDLSSDTLRVEGDGATSYLEKRIGKVIVMPFGKARHIEIHLDQPLNSVDEADAIMGRIFFLGPDAVDHIRPEFRRANDNTPDSEISKVSQREFRPASANTVGSNDNNDKVLPPRPTYTPEPEYSAQASHAKYQGTVVLGIVIDKAGKISRIRLDRPLGMGLDENAMETVKQWRFSPAMRNGEPVAVAMSIEVSFNLH